MAAVPSGNCNHDPSESYKKFETSDPKMRTVDVILQRLQHDAVMSNL